MPKKTIFREVTKHYKTFADLAAIIRSLKWYGYEREGRSSYAFRAKGATYIVHLVNDNKESE